ncbi:MAG: SpoIIE family protein phosphatase, partial [Gammaproteobacteria bacterium]|nr:SpoIIE family protein phosphatase [Gammaproteobacteria bacterium]
TAEVLTFFNNEYYVGHVGDSRTYLFREGIFTQLTKDHSYLQEQIDLGLIRKEETSNHWLKNAIYRAVGHIDEVEVDVHSGRIKTGDCFLLCSDGLTDMVDDIEIQQVLQSTPSITERTQMLVNLAKENGGKDNITVVLCEVINVDGMGQVFSQLKNRFLGK